MRAACHAANAQRAQARDADLLARQGGSVQTQVRQDLLHEPPPHALLERLTDALRPLSGHVVLLSGLALIPDVSRLTEQEPLIDLWMAERRCATALVRPDHIVYGTAIDAERALALVEAAATALGVRQQEPQHA